MNGSKSSNANRTRGRVARASGKSNKFLVQEEGCNLGQLSFAYCGFHSLSLYFAGRDEDRESCT
jgi:hypothetical protein